MKDIRTSADPQAIFEISKTLKVNNIHDSELLLQRLKELTKFGIKDTVKYGAIIEMIFGKILFSLSKCKVIKKEDSGDTYSEDDIKVPDYRVVLCDGRQFLVEVKETNGSKIYRLNDEYVKALERYSLLVGNELKIAIYWTKYNFWCLNSLSDFSIVNNKHCISMEKSFKRNEFAIFGDLAIGLVPNLRLRLITKKEEEKNVEDKKQIKARIQKIEMIYNDKLLKDNKIMSVFFFFMLYGKWGCKELVNYNGTDTVVFEYSFNPHEEKRDFNIIGYLSSMLTRLYKDVCYDKNGEVKNAFPTGLNIDFSPIREYTKSKDIPMWIITIVKNNE